MELTSKLNMRKLKTQEAIQEAIDAILSQYKVGSFLHVKIGTAHEETRTQIGKGRPSKDTQYKHVIKTVFTLGWSRNTVGLRQEARTDGVFPLLCTDPDLTAKEVFQAYKYQPRLEKRFQQFKHIHHGLHYCSKSLNGLKRPCLPSSLP